MATLNDLGSAIDALLDHPLGVSQYQLMNNVEEKAYEAYVFCLCLRAVRELNVTPSLVGIIGSANPFVFRGAPGKIYSMFRNYGYATFSLGGEDFEVHAGVEFKGTSGMTHELDVCIMRAGVADKCRNKPEDPPASSLFAAWECKFYAGPLQKNLGRAFVGLVDDLGTNVRLGGLCSNSDHQGLRQYFQPQRRPHPHFDLTPLKPSNENIFVNMIKAELKKMTAS